MSAAREDTSHSLDARYEGGFDRRDRGSRAGRNVLWRASEHAMFAIGDGATVWVWDIRSRAWNRIPGDEAAVILREHDQAIRRLRRALPVIRLYLDTRSTGEREAARQALQRIGASIVETWQEARAEDSLPRGAGWFDSATAVYLAATRDCSQHFPPAARIAFDSSVFAELADADQEDLRAGRRTCTPRMRPVDLTDGPADAAGPTWQHPHAEPKPFTYAGRRRARPQPNANARVVQEAWNTDVEQLRADIQRDLSNADAAESQRRLRRHRAVLCGAVMGLFTATALVALSVTHFG